MFRIAQDLVTVQRLARRMFSQDLSKDQKRSISYAQSLFEARQRNKEKRKPTNPNRAYLQVIGDERQNLPPSLVLHSEGRSYLFNCGEGMQRYSQMNRVKITSFENVFITDFNWNKIAGIFGFSLTAHDMGGLSMTVHGTELIKDIFQVQSNFIQPKTGMTFCANDITGGKFEDDGATIHSIVLQPPSDNKRQLNAKRAKLPNTNLAYFCKLPETPGKLDPLKCSQLKVPVGPLLAKLKAGEDIQLSDGRVVLSKDVTSPREPGINLLIVDCPSKDMIQSFLSNTVINELKKSESWCEGRSVDYVAHLTSPDVRNDPLYEEWMSGFPDSCKHIMLVSEKSKRLVFVDSYRQQYLLNHIDRELFPTLHITEELQAKIEQEKNLSEGDREKLNRMVCDSSFEPGAFQKDCNLNQQKIIDMENLDKLTFRPSKALEGLDPTIYLDLLLRESNELPNFDEQLQALHDIQNMTPKSQDHEPEVVFLGTGSCYPSGLRNVSGILVNFHYPEKRSIMLDCGEDSYGQLQRLYGPEGTKEILARLKLIYISHYHVDHHAGLTRILLHRKEVTDSKLAILMPRNCDHMLNYFNDTIGDLREQYDIYYNHIFKEKFTQGQGKILATKEVKQDLREKLEGLVRDIKVVGVHHCPHACAVVFEFNIGHHDMRTFSIAYSGDARPCDEFAAIGQGCDLLIHEATFDDSNKPDALFKKHSTTSEAIAVAKKMEAKQTILTHFSQRFSRVPILTEDFDSKVGFAFDFLRVKCPSDFNRLTLLKPILSSVFHRQLTEANLEIEKRTVRKELLQQYASRIQSA